MQVGQYVKVVDNTDLETELTNGDIVKLNSVSSSGKFAGVDGVSDFNEFCIGRFKPLPILTEAPPKGSKVVKVEKSCNGGLDSDRSLGKVFTTVEEGGKHLSLIHI